MALDVLVIEDGHIILPVSAVVFFEGRVVLCRKKFPPTILDKEPGEIEIALLACHAPELDERQLNFRMPGIAEALGRRAEHRINVIGEFRGDAQKIALAGGLKVGHGRLEQVAGAIKLMLVAQVGPLFAGLLHDEITVEVTVRLLGGSDGIDDFVEPLSERRIRVRRERTGGSFERLVNIRIHEDRALETFRGFLGGKAQVLEIARLLEVVEVDRDGSDAIGLPPGRPE